MARVELLTRVAFWLALVIVCARAAMSEVIRDPMTVGPGTIAAPRAVGPAGSLFLDLLSCVPTFLILVRRVMDPTYVLRWSWSHVLMSLLAVWAVASRWWASDKYAAMVQSADFASAMVLLWAGTQLVRSHGRLRIVAGAVVGLLLVYVAHGVNKRFVEFPESVRAWNDPKSGSSRWEYIKATGLSEEDFAFQQFERKLLSGELRGFGNSPNTYAAMLVMMGLISVGVLIQRIRDGDGIGWVIPIVLALVGTAVVLYFTHSRTAMLTPILGLIILFLSVRLEPWMARRPRAVFAGAVVLFFLGVAAVVGHGLKHGSLVEKSMTYRWYYWTGGAKIVGQHPVVGVGWGNFGAHYPEVRVKSASEEVQDPHNFMVRFFAELGIVGGIIGIIWMARLWWEMTRPVEAALAASANVPRRGWFSLGAIALGAAALNLIAGTDWEQDSSWVILQATGAVVGGVLLMLGLAVASIRSWGDGQLDDRPAPWVLRSMQVAIGIFLIHNLIDFSLFETGPMMLFAFVTGSILGVRQPSAAGKLRRTVLVVGGTTVAAILWLFAAGRLWLPTAMAESAAAQGDQYFRRANSLDAAFAQYREALAEQPLNGDFAWKAANVLAHARAPRNLVHQMIDAAIAANPRAAKYHLFKAEYEIRQPSPEKEIVMRSFQNALALTPADVQIRLAYAEALEKLGDSEFAREQYREALRYDDELPKDEPKRLSQKRRRDIESKVQ
jgi:O-antigen ligase